MRIFTLFPMSLITSVIAFPAYADPSHIEQAGGHNHWFELTLGGFTLVALAVWIGRRLSRIATSDHG